MAETLNRNTRLERSAKICGAGRELSPHSFTTVMKSLGGVVI